VTTASKLPSCSLVRESTTSIQRGSQDTATSSIAFGKSTMTLVRLSLDDRSSASASHLRYELSPHSPLVVDGLGVRGNASTVLRST
jgi:hypothetical protein